MSTLPPGTGSKPLVTPYHTGGPNPSEQTNIPKGAPTQSPTLQPPEQSQPLTPSQNPPTPTSPQGVPVKAPQEPPTVISPAPAEPQTPQPSGPGSALPSPPEPQQPKSTSSNVVPLIAPLGPQYSYVQSPRFVALVNGTPIGGEISAEISTNNYSEAARFTLEIIVTSPDSANQPTQNTSQSSSVAPLVQTGQPLSIDTLESMTDVSVEIQISLQGETPTSIIYGRVDTVDSDPFHGSATLTGRDLVGLFIDAPTEQTYENMTSSQIVNQFISDFSSFGVQGNVTTTSKQVGRFYGVDYSMTYFQQLYHATNKWDMILFLAQMEGFVARMDGKTLYFGPNQGSDTTYEVSMDYGPPVTASVERLHLRRSLTLAKDVHVTVVSWQSMTAKPLIREAKSTASKGGGSGAAQNYVIYKPDLTPDQALQLASLKLQLITQREREADIELPGEVAIKPSDVIRISGTQTGWDQDYFIDHIERRIHFADGMTESIRIKNLSPSNQTVVR